MYAFSENFILPFSHDEVVHGKKSLLDKMPGNYEEKFSNLRLLFTYMITHPGKKLLFMGGEFGQFIEWRYYSSLDWLLFDFPMHRMLHYFVKKLNILYKETKALWELDHKMEGFQWIDPNNAEQSVISFIRYSKEKYDLVICICNFGFGKYSSYKIGVPFSGIYKEILNSDHSEFGGNNFINEHEMNTIDEPWHGFPQCIEINLPPLSAIILKPLRITNKIDKKNNTKKEANNE